MNDDDDDYDDDDAMHPCKHPYARVPQIKYNNIFIGTLYYSLQSKEWKVKSVRPTVHRDTVKDGPHPNEMEPTDYIMIAADIRFPRSMGEGEGKDYDEKGLKGISLLKPPVFPAESSCLQYHSDKIIHQPPHSH